MFEWDRVCGARTAVMGIVNVTPDSFSDGGRFLDPDAAVAHGIALAEQGADGIYLRTIIKTEDPDRYGIRVGDYFV